MTLHFPLSDVNIKFRREPKVVENPLYNDGFYRVNQHEFSMHVEGVGSFYASGGKAIEIAPCPDSNEVTLALYLNGSTYGAILHQRGILPMHGSCFVFQGKGVMLCGESGAGKSSLTASFVLEGHDFLTDDVTPITFSEGYPMIRAMSDRIKLCSDSLEQLNREDDELEPIDNYRDKFYFQLPPSSVQKFSLDHVFLLEIQDTDHITFRDVEGAEKFTMLRKEIYRSEYLLGMPGNETKYFQQLAAIGNQIRVTRLIRPPHSPIEKTKESLMAYLQSQYSKDAAKREADKVV
jgi:hypothetical protein